MKMNSREIQTLNVTPETQKVTEENVGSIKKAL